MDVLYDMLVLAWSVNLIFFTLFTGVELIITDESSFFSGVDVATGG